MPLEIKKLKTEKTKNTTKQVTQVYKENEKGKNTISINELKNIITTFRNKGEKNHDHFSVTSVRVLMGSSYRSFGSTDFDHIEDEIDHYYEGKLKAGDLAKFKHFYQIQVFTEYEN